MTAPNAHNRSPRGDAPVTAQEAGALDTWLESITARHAERTSRHLERSRDFSPNGHVDSETPLQATAEAFHARLACAEHEVEPIVPADAIWEKIMATSAVQHSGRAADLVSAPAHRPNDPQRIVPTWLAGSHWAVSALMIAAVVVGIVALYGSFVGSPDPNDDPATDHNFAMASPDEATPPAADADWLQPYTPDECNVTPRTLDDVAAFMQDPGQWPPRQYGPVQPVDEDLALAVASANRVFQSCSLTGETGDWRAMVGPRLIFEGKGSPNFDSIISRSSTYDDFVANHRELSELLLTNPDEVYAVESTQAQPVMEDGLPDYSSTDIYWSVMLPRDLVMLPDGRIGGPERTLLPTNHEQIQRAIEAVAPATPGTTEFEMVAYRIYVQDPTQNGQWVLDETLTLCASGCDAFYAQAEPLYRSLAPISSAQSTPPSATPSANTDWLAPIAPDECDVADTRPLEEVGAVTENSGQIVPREYVPVSDADAAVAQDVASAQRAWESCNAQRLIGERRAVESLRYIAEIQAFDILSYTSSATFEEWVALNETLRAAFLDPNVESYLVESDALPPYECGSGYPETAVLGQVAREVIQPQHIVRLPDGRVGGPVTTLVGPGYFQCLETQPPAIDPGYQVTAIHIYAQDPTRDNRWALDEQFKLCVSGCDDYYNEVESLSGDYAWPATPEAATPVARAAAIQPITPAECNVAALSPEQVSAITQGDGDGDASERTYAPTGPVGAALAGEIAAADRAWQSCYVYGTAGQRAALQSPRLTRDGPGEPLGSETSREAIVANLGRFDATRELGETMLTGSWQDYYIESDLVSEFSGDPVTSVVQALPELIPMAPLPGQAILLGDGRVALPQTQFIPPDTYADALENEQNVMIWWIPVHILVQVPGGDGRWVVDETLTLCMGDCDLARTETVDYLAYLDSLVASPEATPAATRQARPASPFT